MMMMMMMMMNYISRLMTTQFVTIDHNTTAGETAKMYFGKYSFSNDVKNKFRNSYNTVIYSLM